MTIRRSIHRRFQISDFRLLGLLATAGLAILGFSAVGGCTSQTAPPPRDIGQLVKPEERLIHAIETTDINGVRTALATGCDPNSAASGDMPPLHLAASRGFVEAGKLLLDGRAEIDLMNVGKESASSETSTVAKNGTEKNAAEKGPENTTSNETKRRGNTALHTAVMVGNADFVRMLIEHKADLNIRNARDMTPLDLAISQEGALKIAEEQAKDPDRIAQVSEQATKNQAVLAVLREHGARTTQDIEGKQREVNSGGILGRLPEQLKSRPDGVPPRPLDKKLPIEKPPPLDKSLTPESK